MVVKMEVKEMKMSQISLSESNTWKDLVAGTEDAGLDDLAKYKRKRTFKSNNCRTKR